LNDDGKEMAVIKITPECDCYGHAPRRLSPPGSDVLSEEQ
jgi:hypothetical protein